MTGSFHTDSETIPAVSGAYVLTLGLDGALALDLPQRPSVILPPGRYLYCGSARGPGGLRARVGRHLRADKSIRWHIDRLTVAAPRRGAWVFPDGDECALVAELAAAGLPMPVPGFGSSDCRCCVSHLLAWPMGVSGPAWLSDL